MVKADGASDQGAEGCIRGSPDRPKHRAKIVRELVCLEREPGDHAQTATSAPLETPEEIGVGAGIGDAHSAIGGNNFGFQEPGRGEPVAF